MGGERVFVKGRREREKNEVGAGNEYGGDWEKEKSGGREWKRKEEEKWGGNGLSEGEKRVRTNEMGAGKEYGERDWEKEK